jgi:DNA polymerase bacteriophage-type
MTFIHRDYESSSLADINDVGSYRYSCDPSTRILMFAVAAENDEPVLWDFLNPESTESLEAVRLMNLAREEQLLVYAHNTGFELAIDHYRLKQDVGIDPVPHDQLRCTQAMSRRAAIPPSLDGAAKFLKLPLQKGSVGSALIDIFSNQGKLTTMHPPAGMIDPSTIKELKNGKFSKGKKPKTRKSPSPILDAEILWDWLVKVDGEFMTVRAAWELFKNYCRQDVRVEQAIHRKLAPFELVGDELASFQFDMRMNFRGVPVNVKALQNALVIVEEFQERMEARMLKMCGLRSSQGIKLKAWLKERGYEYDDMQADTVEKALKEPEKLTPLAQEVLLCRSLLSFAALKKIPAMLRSVCPDGLVRGTTAWYGARTGRATGRLLQVQNVRKSTIPDSDFAYELICNGTTLDTLEMLWGSPLEVIASCTRHFIQFPGKDMFDADYVGIEGRLSFWICGEQEKLDSILAGVDQYKVAAADVAYNIPYDQVTKEQRTVGKVIELQLVFGASGKGLRKSLLDKQGIDIPLAQCNQFVANYRAKYHKLAKLWRDMDNAAKAAIKYGKVTYVADGQIGFGRLIYGGETWLVIKQPCGRKIYYPRPEVKSVFRKYGEEDMFADPAKRERGGYWSDAISFYGTVEGVWCRVNTHGSKMFENVVQGMGADILNHGCINAEAAGYDIFMIVHDQSLAPSDKGTLEGFKEAFCTKQEWAKTFPLAVSAAVVPYYLKD